MTGIYPGTFDPVTNGHIDIITRSSSFVDRLIVAIADNHAKTPLFTVDERLALLRGTCKLPNVEFAYFSGLLIDFAKEQGAAVIIRGLRAVTDFEYEFQMALTNKMLNSSIETLFISTSAQYSYLSSSIVKEVAFLGGDVDSMVPCCVKEGLAMKRKGSVKRRQ